MLQKYQNFIDRHGKIIFPLYFLSLFLLFIIPSFYCVSTDDVPQHLELAQMYTVSFVAYFYKAIAAPITWYVSYLKNYSDIYSTFSDFCSPATMTYLVVLSLMSIAAIVCAIIFICFYFKNKKTIKSLLLVVPLLYIVPTLIIAFVNVSYKTYIYVPFIAFYIVFVLFIMAVLYCIKTKERISKPHEPSQAERIAELEKQVAELQAKVDNGAKEIKDEQI